MKAESALRIVKTAHSLIWALFAGCILAIPVTTFLGKLAWSALLIALVAVEVVVLLCNGLRCPLTGIAACYTTDRQENFDIYLPLWLARYNKRVFGPLFAAGVLYTVFRWATGDAAG